MVSGVTPIGWQPRPDSRPAVNCAQVASVVDQRSPQLALSSQGNPMFKKLLATVLALFAAAVFAASVDVNKASQAELEAIKGIGPSIAGKILDERKKGSFKDWGDLIERIKGVGEANAAKFSAEGLTVNGTSFTAGAQA